LAVLVVLLLRFTHSATPAGVGRCGLAGVGGFGLGGGVRDPLGSAWGCDANAAVREDALRTVKQTMLV
jgi:hypothetical protein